jgi:hypothetical protein
VEEREIIMAIDYQTQLNKIKEAQKQSAIADLENTRNQALSDLQAEREQNAANFNTQRNQANIQNQLAAKNFKEYLVNSGRANSGIMPQYEMNRQNNLQRSINDINSSQNMALADINRRNTLANQTYNTGLQSANANIEAQYLNNLLAQQQQEWQRQMQEKEFNEKVRQYNENMAWQKQQYQDQLSRQSLGRSYSSGGRSSRSSGGSSGSSDYNISSVSSPAKFSSTTATKWYVNNAANVKTKSQLDSAIASGLKNGKITQKDANNIYKSYGI